MNAACSPNQRLHLPEARPHPPGQRRHSTIDVPRTRNEGSHPRRTRRDLSREARPTKGAPWPPTIKARRSTIKAPHSTIKARHSAMNPGHSRITHRRPTRNAPPLARSDRDGLVRVAPTAIRESRVGVRGRVANEGDGQRG